MAKSYVKFEVSNDVVAKTYEALQLAKQSGTVKKGANEVTKSIERGLATFVAIAGDVEPEEVVIHLPTLCEQKKVPYVFVPSKLELGKSIGLNVQCTAVAVENRGKASGQLDDIAARVTGKPQSKQQSEEKPAKEKPKQEGKEAEKH
ncbi:MAG: 50S ribosomal protein L7Ae [Candidatus Micrarchaeaceae archaeon]